MSTAVQSPIIPPPPGTGSIRRRNALVPLPLLPPVPRNAIVTSVKIVHNPTPPSPTSPSPTSSSASSPEEDQPNVTVTVNGEKQGSRKRPSSTSPTSPTNFYFSPLPKRPRHSRRRSGSRSPKCTSPPTSPTSPPGNRQYFPPQVVNTESMKPKTIKEEEGNEEGKNKSVAEAAVRRPRSTILVTVRLASPPAPSVDTPNPFDALPPAPPSPSPTASLPPTPTLRHKKPLVGSLASRKPRLLSIQNRPQHTRDLASPTFARQRVNALALPSALSSVVVPALPPVPVRPKWNKPRVSSGLVTTSPVVAQFDESTTSMEIDSSSSTLINPTSILRNSSTLNLTPLRPRTSAVTAATSGKKSKKSKTASRIGMLRWAVLNHSGPEIGRRIQAMGVRLAREIWEAERYAEEEENDDGSVMLSRGRRGMSGGVIVASPVGEESGSMECAKEDGESVLPCIEEDEMPAIEHVLEHLGLVSDEEKDAEKERIAEECIRLLEEEMDEDEEMVDPSIADVVSGNGDPDEGRALVEEVERPKAETSIKEEDVEMVDVKEEAKPSGILTSGRRASLATEKFNQDKLVEFNGNMSRRRSSLGLSEDKMPIIVAARKWFGKSAL